MDDQPYYSAGTNKYAFNQIYTSSEMQHRRPSVLATLLRRLHHRRAAAAPHDPATDGPFDLVPDQRN